MLLDIYSWQVDSIAIVLRYFLLAGLAYLFFYGISRAKFFKIKIQKHYPSKQIIFQEIIYSCLTLLIFCAVSWVIFYFNSKGFTQIYTDVDRYGWLYLIGSVLLMIFLHDAYFYWTHRFMHLPKIFRIVHKIHHHSSNPTPWAAFSFHPMEALISAGIIPVIVFLIPSHPYAIFTFLTYMTLVNVLGHLGYETFPTRFRNHSIGKLQNNSTNHNIHHLRSKYNYGLYFTFWDRIMRTYYCDDREQGKIFEIKMNTDDTGATD